MRVLIVDDCAGDVELVVREMQVAGFDADWVRVDTEEEFVDRLQPELDLILCDYVMPEFSGIRALELWRERGMEIPFILISGTIGEDIAVQAIKQGATDYLLKDRLARLGPAVQQALEQERLRRDRRTQEAALRESERTALAVVDGLTAHIAIVDEDGCILSVNARWREFAAQNAASPMAACERVNYIAACEAAARGESPKATSIAEGIREVLAGRSLEFSAEYPRDFGGEERWFTVRVTPFPGEGPRRAVIAREDITNRKRTEERLAQLSRVQAILAGIDRAIVHVPDQQKLLDEVCRVAVDTGGFKLAWIGMIAPDRTVQPVAQAGVVSYLDGIRIVIDDAPDGRGPVGTTIRENRPMVIGDVDRDACMAPWLERARQFGLHYVAAFPIRVGGKVAGSFQVYAPRADFFDEIELNLLTQVSEDISFALTAIADLTERKRLEQEVLEISAREQRRIGQDLHDDLCQWLAGTEFSASALAKDLAVRSSANAARALKIAESIRQSLGRARMLARGLVPAVIEAEGLAGALRELANNSAEMFRIRCFYEGPEAVQVHDSARALHLYRIAQEAISNAVRHGCAGEVLIQLQPAGDRVAMLIRDDGAGIPQPLPQSSGMGLRTMRYRAEIVGAVLEVRPGAKGGTEILCTFPTQP